MLLLSVWYSGETDRHSHLYSVYKSPISSTLSDMNQVCTVQLLFENLTYTTRMCSRTLATFLLNQ